MTEFDDYDPALEDKWDAQREDDCIENRLRREGKVCMACGDPLHYRDEQARGCCRGDQCRNAALGLLRAEVERLRSGIQVASGHAREGGIDRLADMLDDLAREDGAS